MITRAETNSLDAFRIVLQFTRLMHLSLMRIKLYSAWRYYKEMYGWIEKVGTILEYHGYTSIEILRAVRSRNVPNLDLGAERNSAEQADDLNLV